MCSRDLHWLVAHLPRQLRECGPAAVRDERLVECALRDVERPARERAPRAPELVGVRHIMVWQALREQAAGRADLRRLLDPPRDAAACDGPFYDARGDAATGTRLLHKGVLLTGADRGQETRRGEP